MVITEVRIKLCEENNERLLAFCSVTFDNAFVVRDLKIIEGTKGVFVAMPSRKLTDRCGHCGSKNHLRARFCNSCGHKLGGTVSLVTVNLSVDYIGSAKIGQWLQIDSEVLKTGSTICFVQCVVTADGEVIARANATFRAVKKT